MRMGTRRVMLILLIFMVAQSPLGAADLQTSLGTIAADPRQRLQGGVCSLGKTIECQNDGKAIGMFDVAVIPQATIKVGSSIAIANKNDPKKRVYMGYVSGNRQSQVFKGKASVECFLCSGSVAQDPNQRANPCPDPLKTNYCAVCDDKNPIPCSDVLTMQQAQASGAEARAQDANSIIRRLGLTESVPTPAAKK